MKTSYLVQSLKLSVFSLSGFYTNLRFLDSVVDYTVYGGSVSFTYKVLFVLCLYQHSINYFITLCVCGGGGEWLNNNTVIKYSR
jgi:hypothetical protein